jgi:hypothetical protein
MIKLFYQSLAFIIYLKIGLAYLLIIKTYQSISQKLTLLIPAYIYND